MDRFAYLWLGLFVDVSIKSLLLAGVAGVLLRVFRVRDANLRHRVWLGVMIGMLLMPVLVPLTPAIPLPPAWQQQLDRLALTQVDRRPASELVSEQASPLVDADQEMTVDANKAFVPTQPNGPTQLSQSPPRLDDGDLGPSQLNEDGTDVTPIAGVTSVGSVEVSTAAPSAEGNAHMAKGAGWFWVVVRVAAMLHITVALGLLSRIGLGLLLTRRIAHRARIIVPDRPADDALVCNGVEFQESPEVAVPVTVGHWRPRVLLPVQWRQWDAEKLQAVLAHELSHVARGDWLAMVLCQINRAVFWFHPLGWQLKRWLSELAEHCCDDAVLGAAASRTQYARHLLEVATTLRGAGGRLHPSAQFVAMARRPSLESRIDAILDESRPLARRIGVIAGIGLIAATLAVVAVTASIKPVGTATAAEQEREPVAKNANVPGNDATVAENAALDAQMFVYEGKVLTPDGRPAVGAQLYLDYWYSDQSAPAEKQPIVATGPDGRFRFEMKRSDFRRTGDSVAPWQWAALAAFHPDAGMTWAPSMAFETSGNARGELDDPANPGYEGRHEILDRIANQKGELQLVAKTIPIVAKFIDTEGQPVAGVRVSILSLQTGEDNNLDAWEAVVQQGEVEPYAANNLASSQVRGPMTRSILPRFASNDQGEVRIEGLGNERIVKLLIEGDGVRTDSVYCRTRRGDPIEYSQDYDGSRTVFGPSFTHVLVPSRTVEGVVRDRATNQPIAGVVVKSMTVTMSEGPGQMVRTGSDHARAVTDKDGRYSLKGLPRVDQNIVQFEPPRDTDYLSASGRVDTSGDDLTPATSDMTLARGVVVNGRVVDEQTGEGVSGQIEYFIDREDPLLAKREAEPFAVAQDRADIDGRFRMVVPRSLGYLAFRCYNPLYEQRADRPANSESVDNTMWLAYMAFGADKRPEFHAVTRLDFAKDDSAASHEVEMRVGKGRVVAGSVLDDDGQPLAGCLYTGRDVIPRWWPEPLPTDQFNLLVYDPKFPRRVTFVHRDRKLSGTAVISGDPPQPLSVQLHSWGVVKGRVLNDDGDPAPNVQIMAGSMRRMVMARPGQSGATESLPVPLPPTDDNMYGQGAKTDKDGRFIIEGLVADYEYHLMGHQEGSIQDRLQGDIEQIVKVKPGETLDLGDVTLARPDFEALRLEALQRQKELEATMEEEKEQEQNSDASSTSEQPSVTSAGAGDSEFSVVIVAGDSQAPAKQRADTTRAVHGTVVDPQGKPVASAMLHWLHLKKFPPTTIDDIEMRHVATTDAEGRFTAELSWENLGDSIRVPPLVAVKKGYGLAWQELKAEDAGQDVRLRLVEDQIVEGRVVDTEGKPVAGATMMVNGIFESSTGSLDAALTAWKSEWQSATMKLDRRFYMTSALSGILQISPTDDEGRFRFAGLGRERMFRLQVESERTAQTSVMVVTRPGFKPQQFNDAAKSSQRMFVATSRHQFLLLAGPEVSLVVESAQALEGTVTDIATGKPLPGVSVQVSVGYGGGISAITDALGRYRLNGMLAEQEWLVAFRAPSETRYLTRTLAVSPSESGAMTTFDVQLAKGVLLKGRVVDLKTGEGVVAGVRTAPLPENEFVKQPGFDNYLRSRVMESAGSDGTFEFAVPPGPQVLMVQAMGAGMKTINGQPVKIYKKGKFSSEELARVKLYDNGRAFYISEKGLDMIDEAVKLIDVPDDNEEYSVEIAVDPGLQMEIDIQDSDGQPLAGTIVSGMTASWPNTFAIDDTTCTVYALDPDEPRQVIFYHPQRALCATAELHGDETARPVVRLLPALDATGRLVDATGSPLVDTPFSINWVDDTAREFQRQLNMTQNEPLRTDSDGRFRIEGMLPDFAFLLQVSADKQTFLLSKRWGSLRDAASSVTGEDGTIALGDVAMKAR
ncbi:MAG: M56 family metallopeptidase [Pirellulaceae bacterium]|nr:hypothetical protein [Planctomycetales bacterium]